MARSSSSAHSIVLVLCTALMTISGPAVAVAGGVDVVTYSFPAFDASTTDAMDVATNTSVLISASLLLRFPSDFRDINASEGFLLLQRTVDIWRAGTTAGAPDLEASFNTSFTLLAGAAPVSFVVLKDTYPLLTPGGLRGATNNGTVTAGAVAPSNVTGSLAAVEVGPVRSYGPDVPAAGLNVTVTPRGVVAVWIEYRATVHRLAVYVAGAGEPRPADALVSVPLGGADDGRWTTETALVGFFAGAVGDVVRGVRGWDLTVETFPGDGGKKKGASWWVVLLAVVGSVVAAAAVVTVAVCCFKARRRRQQQLNVDPKI